jgi:DNA-binding MarR family transcriptional regulator
VTRLPHPTDGRSSLIAVTDEGRRLALKATAALNTDVFGRPLLEPAEARRLVRVLEVLRRNAGDLG